MWLEPIELIGVHCYLQPLSHAHLDGLIDSVRDGELWELWYTLIPGPEKMEAEVQRRLSLLGQGLMLPFTIFCKKTDTIVGATTFLNVDSKNLRVEIGSTWIGKSAQRTGINTDAKFLLLKHAFEKMMCNAVEFRTHFCNQQSKKAIERLGAKLDGVLRNHMIMPDQTLRDTCVYSVLNSEWPMVKANITWMLARKRQADISQYVLDLAR